MSFVLWPWAANCWTKCAKKPQQNSFLMVWFIKCLVFSAVMFSGFWKCSCSFWNVSKMFSYCWFSLSETLAAVCVLCVFRFLDLCWETLCSLFVCCCYVGVNLCCVLCFMTTAVLHWKLSTAGKEGTHLMNKKPFKTQNSMTGNRNLL